MPPRKPKTSAADFLPADDRDLEALRDASKSCRGCPLYANATQTVFGEGPSRARLMLIGEQPGDQEDRQGHPFVGPAGRVLAEALERAAIDPKTVWVTNAVKHFKFELRGKRRIHSKPNAGEVQACLPWLRREIEVVEPAVLVLLGATASQAVLGKSFRISTQRGQRVERNDGPPAVATWHPSAVLRAREAADRERMLEEMVGDLIVARDGAVAERMRA